MLACVDCMYMYVDLNSYICSKHCLKLSVRTFLVFVQQVIIHIVILLHACKLLSLLRLVHNMMLGAASRRVNFRTSGKTLS